MEGPPEARTFRAEKSNAFLTTGQPPPPRMWAVHYFSQPGGHRRHRSARLPGSRCHRAQAWAARASGAAQTADVIRSFYAGTHFLERPDRSNVRKDHQELHTEDLEPSAGLAEKPTACHFSPAQRALSHPPRKQQPSNPGAGALPHSSAERCWPRHFSKFTLALPSSATCPLALAWDTAAPASSQAQEDFPRGCAHRPTGQTHEPLCSAAREGAHLTQANRERHDKGHPPSSRQRQGPNSHDPGSFQDPGKSGGGGERDSGKSLRRLMGPYALLGMHRASGPSHKLLGGRRQQQHSLRCHATVCRSNRVCNSTAGALQAHAGGPFLMTHKPRHHLNCAMHRQGTSDPELGRWDSCSAAEGYSAQLRENHQHS